MDIKELPIPEEAQSVAEATAAAAEESRARLRLAPWRFAPYREILIAERMCRDLYGRNLNICRNVSPRLQTHCKGDVALLSIHSVILNQEFPRRLVEEVYLQAYDGHEEPVEVSHAFVEASPIRGRGLCRTDDFLQEPTPGPFLSASRAVLVRQQYSTVFWFRRDHDSWPESSRKPRQRSVGGGTLPCVWRSYRC